SILPSPLHSTRQAAGAFSGVGAGADCELAAVRPASTASAAVAAAMLPAGAAGRRAGMEGLPGTDGAALGRAGSGLKTPMTGWRRRGGRALAACPRANVPLDRRRADRI